MADENTTIRNDLEAAFEQHAPSPEEKGGPPQNTPEPVRDTPAAEAAPATETPVEGAPATEAEAGRVRNADGTFAPKPGEIKPEVAPATAAPIGDGKSPVTAPVVTDLTPPIGWKPAAREHWKAIPKAAQEEILRREQETSKALSHSVNARRTFDEFNQVIGPFMPLIQAQNSTPFQAIKNLMSTAAGLTVGTTEQKARIVREIIQNYGVNIETLDKVLAGTPVDPKNAQVGAHNTPPAWAQPIFQFMQGVQSTQKNRQQQIDQEAITVTEAFAADPKHEFYEDVRQGMADRMELAARRGRELSLQQAYDMECQDTPEIKAVLEQRTRAAAAAGGGTAVARARAAAATVVGQPRNAVAPTVPADRRGEISAAWDQHSGQ